MNAKTTSVGVVIPTYTNDIGLAFLWDALGAGPYEFVVVDNKPSMQKSNLMRGKNRLYLPQKENLGFACSVNLGAAELATEWLLLLNDDIEITVAQINTLLRFAIDRGFDAAVPVFVNSDGDIENIGYIVLPIGKIELNFDVAKHTSDTLDGVTAACLLVKRRIYEALGGMDEKFVSYLEDVDFCLRMKQEDLRFGVNIDMQVLHHHRQTSKYMPVYKAKRDMINWFLLIRKHWSLTMLIKYFPGIFLERLLNISGYIKTYSWKHR